MNTIGKYVLRFKGYTSGNVFYSYLEENCIGIKCKIATEKFTNAHLFSTEWLAKDFKSIFDMCDGFDVVSYEQAEKEYREEQLDLFEEEE